MTSSILRVSTQQARPHQKMASLVSTLGALVVIFGAQLPASELVLPDWEMVDTNPEISRQSLGIANDSHRGVVVVFGGRSSNVALSDTLEFDGDSWSPVATGTTPAARFWHAMAFDSGRQVVVLFGGGDRDVGILFDGTWEYDGADWQQVTTVHSPPPMDSMSMAYDSSRNKIVVFGGSDLSVNYDDTWEYDGSDWTFVNTAVSPPSSNLAAMAFDEARGRTVLLRYDGSSDAATWEYDGSNWALVTTPTSPPGRWAHAMVYDSIRQRVVLWGGYSPNAGSQDDDCWEYDGVTWTQVSTPTTPPAREQHGMAYDPARGHAVMFGASGLGDTWVYLTLPLIFTDGFEFGDTLAWSATMP